MFRRGLSRIETEFSCEPEGGIVEIINIVALGALDVELDLERLADDIGEPVVHYNPNKYPRMYLRFEEDAPLIAICRTGKFIITGVDSEDESYSLRERLLNLFAEMDVIKNPEDEWFAVQNYAYTGELDQSPNLNAFAIGLGLGKTEYEPEQFPGLIYRPEGAEGVVLLFATGKVVITGRRSIESVEEIFAGLTGTVLEFLQPARL